jgi:hypothetical protein
MSDARIINPRIADFIGLRYLLCHRSESTRYIDHLIACIIENADYIERFVCDPPPCDGYNGPAARSRSLPHHVWRLFNVPSFTSSGELHRVIELIDQEFDTDRWNLSFNRYKEGVSTVYEVVIKLKVDQEPPYVYFSSIGDSFCKAAWLAFVDAMIWKLESQDKV